MLIYLLYIILSPILWVLLLIISFINNKIGRHWRNQWSTIRNAKRKIIQSCNNRKIIIFHAASAGEFEQLKPILKLIDREKYFIIQSFFSPTIYDEEKNTSLADATCYHPFDFFWSALFFLKSINPDYYIITRHDIWPTHIFFANLQKIKTILINANLHDNSTRLKFGLIYFNRWLFSKFDKILTGSERLKNNLKLLTNSEKIICTGDSRFDRVNNRMEETTLNYFSEEIPNTKNILLGSILLSDIESISNGINKFYPDGDYTLNEKKHRLIIVPHEVDETTLTQIENQFMKLNLHFVRYSQMENELPHTILIDKIGILADLYGYAELAYVGGGFGAGVHSVIEPAVYGCAVSFGPNIGILDEAVEMYEKGIGIMVKSGDDFHHFLNLLHKEEKLKQIQINTKHFVKKKKRSAQIILNELFKR